MALVKRPLASAVAVDASGHSPGQPSLPSTIVDSSHIHLAGYADDTIVHQGQPLPGVTFPQGSPSRPRVLVVDDELQTRELLVRTLSGHGYVVDSVGDGEAALMALEDTHPDLVLLDVELPGLSGFDVCREIKRRPGTRLIPVVLVTGLGGREHKITGIHAGADDFLSKPYDREELLARVGSLLRLKRYTDELESAESVILSLALTVEARDPYTNGHCQRLAAYSKALGASLHLPEDQLSSLERGGYLHDVGKIGISDAVLLKPSRLTPGEFETIKQHTVIGERLCGELHSLAAVRPIVRHHHERRDGSGYPDGLRGNDIPLLAQIVGIADTYDAITTTRPYRTAMPADHAYGELTRETAMGLHDPALVREFIALGRAGNLNATAATVRSAPLPAVRAE